MLDFDLKYVYYNYLSSFYIILNYFIPKYSHEIIKYNNIIINYYSINNPDVSNKKRKYVTLFMDQLIDKNKDIIDKIIENNKYDNNINNYDKIIVSYDDDDDFDDDDVDVDEDINNDDINNHDIDEKKNL